MTRIIAVDLGGTKTEVMLSEENPLQVIDRRRVPTAQEEGYPAILRRIAGLILDYKQGSDSQVVVGMGIPGTIDPKTGLVRNSNTQCLIGQPLQKDLEALVGQPIAIDNDANCFALAEARLGAGQGKECVLGIIMGTGLGGGIVINGQVRRGFMGIAAEWGHSSINYQGPLCWCGRKGCLETYISGTGVERHYEGLTKRHLALKDIYREYAQQNDPQAAQVMKAFHFHFGQAMANLIACFDPDLIVLGGGASNVPSLYTQGVEEVAKNVFNNRLETPIVQNQLGDSSGIYGAALVALGLA